MACHYIIDGYNVIKRLEALADLKLQAGREALLSMIDRFCPQGSARNEVTVVFDGQDDVWGIQQPSLHSRVVFTSGISADEWIKRQVEDHRHPKSLVVVSDDREIQCYVRKLGAGVRGVDEFFKMGKRGDDVRRKAPGPELKHLSRSDEERINRELERHWFGGNP